jgi:hypothetical protein
MWMKKQIIILTLFLTFLLLSGCQESTTKTTNDTSNSDGNDQFSILMEDCEGEGTLILDEIPMEWDDLEMVQPMGGVHGSHVTPVDHSYWFAKEGEPWEPERDYDKSYRYNIKTPADGVIKVIEIFELDDHRLEIVHTCEFYSIFIHFDINDEILSAAGIDPQHSEYLHKEVNIPVEKGEIIGTNFRKSFDFSLHYSKKETQFIHPEHYESAYWVLHTVDIFDYFEESIRDRLLDLNIRKVTPYGGKVDYDIDGRLIGNWFEENTNWFEGTDEFAYYKTHIAIVYDDIDPDFIMVSFGDYQGESKQFGVKGNSPDPADVSIETGLVEYELVGFSYFSGSIDIENIWIGGYADDIFASSEGFVVVGTVLFQLVEDQKLKMEIFPDKTADQVTGFTGYAKFYER